MACDNLRYSLKSDPRQKTVSNNNAVVIWTSSRRCVGREHAVIVRETMELDSPEVPALFYAPPGICPICTAQIVRYAENSPRIEMSFASETHSYFLVSA